MDFKKEFLETIEDSINDACLMILTTLALRHIDKENEKRYNDIKQILSESVIDKPEIIKIKKIIDLVEKYDTQLINYLKEVEVSIAKVLKINFSESNKKPSVESKKLFVETCKSSKKDFEVVNSELKQQRKEIKKWWE